MKNNKAITLISLIITVILLIILGAITINITINGGILDKSKNALSKYSEEEICSKIKIAYLNYEEARLTRTNLNLSEFLTSNLESTFGEGQVTNVSLKNKKLKVTIGDKTYQYDIKSRVARLYVDPISYGTKTQATVEPGDDITIGTEKFMVFAKSATEIKAMPYYNLKINETPIKQVTEECNTYELAGTTSFSTEKYWTDSNDTIDMNDSRNLIQQYIIAYKTTLEGLGAEGIVVRAAKYSELSATNVTNNMRNPVGNTSYWLGSSDREYVYKSNEIGVINPEMHNNKYIGVRPIIIIPVD